jgi:hypothetical protein
MGKILILPGPLSGPQEVYCYGETILARWPGRALPPPRDESGREVQPGEYYQVTPAGIRRID